jgi:hypothetical protein
VIRLRRRWQLGGLVLVAGVFTIIAALGPASAGASAMPPVTSNVTTTTYINAPGGIPSMLPQPNTGVAPRDADDRGGWGQYAVFYGILASGVIIFGLVVLESRRKLRMIRTAEAEAAGAPQDEADSTLSEPVADTSVKRPDSSARQ